MIASPPLAHVDYPDPTDSAMPLEVELGGDDPRSSLPDASPTPRSASSCGLPRA